MEVIFMIFLIDPLDPTLNVCAKCPTLCRIKPMYGIII